MFLVLKLPPILLLLKVVLLLVLVLMGVLPNCFAAAAIVLPKLSKSTSVTRCRLTKPSIALSMTLSICLDVPYCIRNFRTSKAFSFSLFWIDKSLSRRDCDIVERLEGMFDLRVERLVRRAMAFFEPMLSLGILILLDIGVPVRKHVELFLLVFFPQNSRQRTNPTKILKTVKGASIRNSGLEAAGLQFRAKREEKKSKQQNGRLFKNQNTDRPSYKRYL